MACGAQKTGGAAQIVRQGRFGGQSLESHGHKFLVVQLGGKSKSAAKAAFRSRR